MKQQNNFMMMLQQLFGNAQRSSFGSNTKSAKGGEYRQVQAGKNALPLSEQLKEKSKKEKQEKKARKQNKKMGKDFKQSNPTVRKTNTAQMTGITSVGSGLGIPSSSGNKKAPKSGLSGGGMY